MRLIVAICLAGLPGLSAAAATLPAVAGLDPLAAAPGAVDWLDHAGLAATVRAEARGQGVPPDLADAVAAVETGYSPYVTGSSGEIGLMQVMPATARMLGFAGRPVDLFDPPTNIRLGVRYLAQAWAASGGNVCRALMKYRAGVGEERYSPLSIGYCQRAMAHLRASGSALATGPGAVMPALPYAGPAGFGSDRAVMGSALAVFARTASMPVTIAARTRLIAGHALAVPGGSPGLTIEVGQGPPESGLVWTRAVSARRIDARPAQGYAADGN